MDLLQVKNNRVADARGQPFRLRGVCIGGWMNMENFINGYPGVEHGIREALTQVLGKGKTEFFFDRWMDHFFAPEDVAFIKAQGANVVRLALNYRHFENDLIPFEYNEKGFERLQRAVEWCAQHELYVILDMHAAQGWQNPDWHSDNANGPALLWAHKQFQDRFVALWEELARRYRGNATIAGYDLLNEPQTLPAHGTHRWSIINALYRRTVDAIRAIDAEHIIFLEGDGFGGRFEGFDAPFAENIVYSAHSYSPACFGPGEYPGLLNGKFWDRAYMGDSNARHQGFKFVSKYDAPMWVGEFGAVYNVPDADSRMRALYDQIDVFEEVGAHWTAWTYKDVGVMAWLAVDAESDYLQRVRGVLEAKRELNTDAWMSWMPPTRTDELTGALARHIEATIDDPSIKPPDNFQALKRAVSAGYAATVLEGTWAKQFEGMSETEIDTLLQSFAFRHCQPRQDLLYVMRQHLTRPMR